MAHFYGEVTGSAASPATRGGGKKSGITGHIRGWNAGAYVEVNHVDGEDVVTVYATKGSSSGGAEKRIAKFTADTLGALHSIGD